MREGNSLVRSGLYRAGLLRYREAAAAGIDSPLLHYNLGIVYYRLERYGEAEQSFARAGEDSELLPLATYNRGLAQLALGDTVAAEASFQAVANSPAGRKLRRLADRAADRAARPERATVAESADGRTRARRPESRPNDFRLLAFARVAQDDNVYRAPAEPYVDLAAQGQPTVTPVVYSASFIPVDVLAEYVLPNEAEDTEFLFSYRLSGDFYDSEFSNANRVSQEASIGADIVLGERANRRRVLDSAFFVRTHDETNFNPDDGIDRTIDGEDISEQFRYRSAGTDIEYGHEIGSWQWGFDLSFERRQYDETPIVTNYDHAYYQTSVWTEHAIGSATDLRFGLRQYRRVYDERRSRDLTGVLLSTNPALRYTYDGAQVGVRRELGRAFELTFDYLLLDRTDAFEGYADSTQNVVRLGAVYRPNDRIEVAVSASSRVYDYPNAFAFNLPAAGARELEAMAAGIELEYTFNRRLSLWAALQMLDVTSTDARSEYARSVSMLGVKWRRQ